MSPFYPFYCLFKNGQSSHWIGSVFVQSIYSISNSLIFLVTAIFLRKRKCIFREKKWLDDKTPSNTNNNIIIIVITVTFTFSSILLPNQICLLLTSSDAKRKSNLLISRRLHIIPIIFIKYPISANYWGKHSFYHL